MALAGVTYTNVELNPGVEIHAFGSPGATPQLVANDKGKIVRVLNFGGWKRQETGVQVSEQASVGVTWGRDQEYPDIFANHYGSLWHIAVRNGRWVGWDTKQRLNPPAPITAAFSGEGTGQRFSRVYSLEE